MKKKIINYKPEDYTFRITKETIPNPNTNKCEFKLHIIEFDIDYFFESIIEIESKVYKIIKGLMKTRKEIQKLPLPIPLKYSKEFHGKFIVRISPELHRKLYIEAIENNESLNKVIEKKLKAAG
jgi:hypothetical protein